MIELLQQYLAINTAHPSADYFAAVALFKQQATADGFLVRAIVLPSGNPVLVITYAGSDPKLPALALNHHMDVVPADNLDEWTVPPFGGTVRADNIYGRGTQDCKGLGVVHYAALKHLKQSGITPARTIHMVMVPDEERGGFHGTKEFLEHPLFESLNIGYVLDEGMPSGDNAALLLKVAERIPIQIKVTSNGTQAHASGLQHLNCAHALISFVHDVVGLQQRQQQLLAKHQPGHLISMHVTSLVTNNSALNVIPSQAYATIDVRIPSHVSLGEGNALIRALMRKHPTIHYEVLATSVRRLRDTATDSCVYQTLAQAVRAHGFTPKPFAFEATTDARFYSHKGIQTLGFTPFCAVPRLHGTDEYIRIEDVQQGVAILHTFLRDFCA